MISAEKLIRNSFVLRKDNWEKAELYQRLIKKKRIQGIRKHLATKRRAFMNNIIVSLPDSVQFNDASGKQVGIAAIQNYDQNYTLSIPDEYNSICIIDGQHRVYAHYEAEDSLEREIAPLRRRLDLLVTGLIFPDSMSPYERRKFESEIFLDINSNAKPVPADVLLFIQTLQDPFSDVGIARKVLDKLNRSGPFHNLLQMSSTEVSRIKIASIVKFALRGLVEITDGRKDTFHYHWLQQGGQSLVGSKDEALLDEYVNFIATSLSLYFGALRTVYQKEWYDEEFRILSTTSINGFIIALRRLLETEEFQDRAYYMAAFKKLTVPLSRADFPYASSRYRMFSKDILRDCFDIDEDRAGDDSPEATAER